MKRLQIGFIGFCIIVMSACSKQSFSLPTLESVSQANPASGDKSAITPIPTPSSEKAVITGSIFQGVSEAEPVSGAILYLADVVNSLDGRRAAASFNRQTSPSAQTDINGRFVFAQVEPKEYALVLDRIYNSFLLQDPNDGGDFLFTADAGELLDLGELIYLSIPESMLE